MPDVLTQGSGLPTISLIDPKPLMEDYGDLFGGYWGLLRSLAGLVSFRGVPINVIKDGPMRLHIGSMSSGVYQKFEP